MTPNSWHSSTFSGGDCCVEVAYRTSSACGSMNCVEVATGPGRVLVRDTKDRTRPPAEFSSTSWAAFVASVRAREFDPVA